MPVLGKYPTSGFRVDAAGPPKAGISAGAVLLINIGQLLTLRSSSGGARRGAELNELGIIRDGAVLSVGGKIVSVGNTSDALRDPWVRENRRKITEFPCEGKVVVPGFVDAHTHPVFMDARLIDFEKRVSGASYEEIAESGGGIRSSLKGVRRATRNQLAQRVLATLEEMGAQGTTTVEAKSGYGLTIEAELKSLEAIREAACRWPGTVVPTLLGAHVVPPEFLARSHSYVDAVCKEMIPLAAKRNLAAFVDVFTERGAFSLKETETILRVAAHHCLATRVHVCQLAKCNLQPILKYHPASLDHLDYVEDGDVAAIAKLDTVATLVPASNYFLATGHFPPARKLIDAGVPVALATDYNPGTSPTTSMPFVLSLACTQMKMSAAEAIVAATMNGACSLRLGNRKGSLEPGKDADIAVFEVADYREIPYWVAANRCSTTILNGIPRTE
ncbi:MAG: imidazolonepropionase [Acidobacteria bacterium]|nr:imidazolonepropionase [Acidobacteriota bacterium]